ncbi:MAG TPA: cyclic pyranopterin monophosphate synthase MoaC [Actinomycetota bacterium]|nr:cyclic pyranopterin monophosphate synthase MoaC [Actinomycetota bacterium]
MTEPQDSSIHPEARARMVDVSGKDVTVRTAVAEGVVKMSGRTRALIVERKLDKGDALEVARIAGIMAAKKTSELVPLCHPIGIDAIAVALEPVVEGISIRAEVRTSERTGVEMEALTATSVAALTIYDMVKGTERGVEISGIRLVSKSGGRSGDWVRPG